MVLLPYLPTENSIAVTCDTTTLETTILPPFDCVWMASCNDFTKSPLPTMQPSIPTKYEYYLYICLHWKMLLTSIYFKFIRVLLAMSSAASATGENCKVFKGWVDGCIHIASHHTKVRLIHSEFQECPAVGVWKPNGKSCAAFFWHIGMYTFTYSMHNSACCYIYKKICITYSKVFSSLLLLLLVVVFAMAI